MLEIVKDKAFLSKKCAEFVFPISEGTIKEMVDLMRATKGVGLAANQVGIPYRFFVAEYQGRVYKIFNPEILKMSRNKLKYVEGCLSQPGKQSKTSRFQWLKLRHQDENGRWRERKVFGMLAIIFQHEIDHLNGVLI